MSLSSLSVLIKNQDKMSLSWTWINKEVVNILRSFCNGTLCACSISNLHKKSMFSDFLGHVLDLLQVFEFRTMKQLEIHGGENRPQRPSQFPLTGSLAFRETCPRSHYWKSRVGPLIAGKAEWGKLERTSCSRSTLHWAVQLVNNPLKACKRKRTSL